MLEGIAGHCMAAGPAVAAAGDRAAALGGELTVVGGALGFRVLGLDVGIDVKAAEEGGLRARCAIPAGGEEVVDVPAAGVRAAMADIAGYLGALGDLSMQADGGGEVGVPGFVEWAAATRVGSFRRGA